MDGVKSVKAVLHRAVGKASLAIVQPDGHQRRQRPQLDGQIAAHDGDGEKHQPANLSGHFAGGAAGRTVDTVEHSHQQHAPAAVVGVDQLQQAAGGHHDRARQHKGGGCALFQGAVHEPAHQRTGQQRPQHVLGIGIPHRAAGHQVEGDLRQQGKHQQPRRVFLPVVGVYAALGDQKTEDGEGHPTDAPQPHGVGKQRRAHVVNEHGADGNELQVEAVEDAESLHVSSPFASRITPPSTQQTPSRVQMLRVS